MVAGALVAGIAGGMLWTFAAFQVWKTHGQRVEHATVISAVQTDHRRRCGRYDTANEWVNTYLSQDAPVGRRVMFADKSCHAARVGATIPVVRVFDADGDTTVYLNPARHMSQAFYAAGIGFAIVFPAATVFFMIREAVSRLWHRRRR